MSRYRILGAVLSAMLAAAGAARADDNTVTIGMVLPMTGPFASTGRQERAAAELYMHEHGDMVAGKKIVLEIKDDTGAPDVTKRLAEELVGNDHAKVLMGFGLTPLALATAQVATEAKVPEIVTAAATAMITEKSPYIVRTSFTLPQASVPMAKWALKNGIKKVVTLVTDYGPGIDAEKWFARRLRERRRNDQAEDSRAAEESGFRAFPAARPGRRPGRGVRLCAVWPGRRVHEGVRRARPRQGRNQADRHRRRDRR